MKRLLCLYMALMLCLCGCDHKENIVLFCREEGSGTREMFVKELGILKNGIDSVTDDANITGSGAVMLSAVAGNENAIGFISAATVNDDVKVLHIDGKTVQDGEAYPLSRDFLLAFHIRGLNEAAIDFLSYIKSQAAAEIIREMGYSATVPTGSYVYTKRQGKVVVGGSASVFPLMDKLREAYCDIQPDVEIEIQQNDSSTGIALVRQDLVDIAMSSREITSEELDDSYYRLVLAKDAIAVIVNPKNALNDISTEQLKLMYEGEFTKWDELL